MHNRMHDSRSAAAAPRRCDECELHLGRDVLRALATCPRWGLPRAGIEIRCAAFVPKEAA